MRREGQAGLGRSRGGAQQQPVVRRRVRLEGEHRLAVLHDHALGERQPVGGASPQRPEARALPTAGEPVHSVPGDVAGVGDAARAVEHGPQQRVRVVDAHELDGHRGLLLHDQLVPAATADPVQGIPDVEEEVDGVLPAHVRDVSDPRCGDPLQDRRIAEAAVGLLEIGLEQLARLAEPSAPRTDHLVQSGQAAVGHGPPVPQHGALQLIGERRVSGDHPRVEQAEQDLDVVGGEASGLAHGADTVVELHPGVPDRVPQGLGRAGRLGRPGLVQEEQVEVAADGQLAAAVAADGDEAERVGGRRGGLAEHARQPLVGQRREGSATPRAGQPGATRHLRARGRVVLRLHAHSAPRGLRIRARRCGPGRRCRPG